MQGGAGQGVHMAKPKFSIKTEVLGGGGGTVAVAVAETEADRPPPPLCFPVDAFLLTVLSGGLLAREVLYYALCGAISAAKGHHRAPRGPANTVAVHVQCAVQRGAGQCRAVQGRACTCQNMEHLRSMLETRTLLAALQIGAEWRGLKSGESELQRMRMQITTKL